MESTKLGPVPTPPEANGNPLVALAVAIIYAFLYLLQTVKYLVAWVTITVPRWVDQYVE